MYALALNINGTQVHGERTVYMLMPTSPRHLGRFKTPFIPSNML